jgi:peptidoglycan-N-acetylmuramic acid deacetylase
MHRARRVPAVACRAVALALAPALAFSSAALAAAAAPCAKPVYLTFDTGHMGVAPLVAQVLKKHDVRVTFFLADERTLDGGSSLDDRWAPWWRERAAEGHAFGSHTMTHLRWLADRPDGSFDMRSDFGPQASRRRAVDAAGYCAELAAPAVRFKAITGQAVQAWFRAPGGRTSPALLDAARACGWSHVGWSDAGFLGDELPSDRHPNAQLLKRALQRIRPGDVLLAHLGIWSRRDPWAPAVLEPLITGLQAQGFCFATLREHPVHGRSVAK